MATSNNKLDYHNLLGRGNGHIIQSRDEGMVTATPTPGEIYKGRKKRLKKL